MLDDRRSLVLQALVEEYIRSGEPVSSQAILDRSGLAVSSATIRNDLAKLESYGFVAQPHTSAGRVPTQQGYRFYVDHCSPARLRAATRARIEGFFADVHEELSRLLQQTSGLLSDISSYPAVVIGPGFGSESVLGLHLVHLGPSVVLVVTVAESGRVSQEVVRLKHEPTDAELDVAERMLESIYVGKTVGEASIEADATERADVSDRVRRLVKAVTNAMSGVERATSDLYVGGTTQLASLWHDLAHVQTVLGLLERDGAMHGILSEEAVGTSVRFGEEINVEDVDLAVVSTSYEAGDHGSGRVGVLGPTRMDYRRTIKIVEEVGERLADSLGT